jgi:hypothetical protein
MQYQNRFVVYLLGNYNNFASLDFLFDIERCESIKRLRRIKITPATIDDNIQTHYQSRIKTLEVQLINHHKMFNARSRVLTAAKSIK